MTDDELIAAYVAGAAVRTLCAQSGHTGRTIRRILDDAGMSIQDVADRIGVSYAVARDILHEAGASIRTGMAPAEWGAELRAERLAFGEKAYAERLAGKSINRIATEHGHVWNYVRRCLREYEASLNEVAP